MKMAIHGLATALPKHSIEQADAAEIARTFLTSAESARLLPALFRRTQVRTRNSVLLETAKIQSNGHSNAIADGHALGQTFYMPARDENDRGPATQQRMDRYAAEAGPLALEAATGALKAAGIDPSEITHLITVSCTGFFAPGVDIGLINDLPLPPTVGRLHVGFMGCHGALNALRVAQSIVGDDPAAVVLIVAVELCSLHYQYGFDSDKLVANALFADGAAALVGRAQQANGRVDSQRWKVVSSGSYLVPDSGDAMSWRIGDHGFQMTLSPRVPEWICQHLRPFLETWLKRSGRTIEEIACWAVHPGGPRILTSVAEALSLPTNAMEPSAAILAECGNMSSPTVLFVLERLWAQGARPPCVILGFGPGLVAEAALLE